MSLPHPTRRIQVWADIDEGIADFVTWLNTIPGVTTHASCQGTIGEGGPNPYRGYAMAHWTDEAFSALQGKVEFQIEGTNWGYIYPLIEGLKI